MKVSAPVPYVGSVVVLLLLACAGADTSPAIDRRTTSAQVQSISIQGVPPADLQRLLELPLSVRRVDDELIAPADEEPAESVPIRALAGPGDGQRIRLSVVDLAVEAISGFYARPADLRTGTRVEVRESDLARLLQGNPPRVLIFRVRLPGS
jgi:hypothetical protein